MLIECVLALILGITFGTFTGLVPGIHINLVGALILAASSTVLISFMPIYFVIFIVAMSVTHTFVDFIPSIFLGCPNADTSLSILPGHQMLKEGRGLEAIWLTAIGGITSTIIFVILAFPFSKLISVVYPAIKKLIPFILIALIFIMILTERKKFAAIIIVILTGLLGYLTLNAGIKEPLLPLLSGLFGSSMLIISLKEKTKIPPQKIMRDKIDKRKFSVAIFGSLIASPVCGLLPGLGSGQAAILGSQISKTDNKNFLVLLGATNSLVMGLSFVGIYAIERGRTGSAVAIQDLIGNFGVNILIVILLATLLSAIIAFFITIKISKKFAALFEKINYAKASVFTLIVLGTIVFLISGFVGFITLIISTLTGIFCISLDVKRTQMLSCMLIPTIILYLF